MIKLLNDSIIPLILAAGKSSRFGLENKLLYKVEGKYLIEHTLQAFIDIFKTIIIVIGYDKNKVVKIIEKINHSNSKIIHIINEDWDTGGMSSSVKKCIEYINDYYSCNGILIHPGDIPFITKNDIKLIVFKAMNENYQKIIIPQNKSKNGHPVYLPNKFFHQINQINEKTEGLRGFLKEHSKHKKFISCGPGILKDIDEKKDISFTNLENLI